MQEILNWLLAHPILTLIILFSVLGSGSSKKNKKRPRSRRPHPRPDVFQDPSPKSLDQEKKREKGEKDWMEALREMVKDPETHLSRPKYGTGDTPLSSAEMAIPERFQESGASTSPLSTPPALPVLPEANPRAGSRQSSQRHSLDEGSVFSKELVKGGGYSGTGGLDAADVGGFRETQAFSGQGGDLVFESSLDNMELAADHSSAWGVAVLGRSGGLEGMDPQVLLLGQLLLGPPRGLRSYEEETMLPGIEA